jgi:hypothetical protein
VHVPRTAGDGLQASYPGVGPPFQPYVVHNVFCRAEIEAVLRAARRRDRGSIPLQGKGLIRHILGPTHPSVKWIGIRGGCFLGAKEAGA